jgi:hypothetical protein
VLSVPVICPTKSPFCHCKQVIGMPHHQTMTQFVDPHTSKQVPHALPPPALPPAHVTAAPNFKPPPPQGTSPASQYHGVVSVSLQLQLNIPPP